MATETPNLPEQMYQRPGTAVATVNSDEGLNRGDILIPRMKLGQKTSRDVLAYGGVYVLTSRDDMDPQLLASPAASGELGDPVRFYVHGDPIKGWSWKPAQKGGEWRGRDYPDLRLVEEQDPRNVRRTYDYLITLPEFPMLPVMFIMHGQWGGQAAKMINTQLLLSRQKGLESHTIAFKLQAKKTSSPRDGQERPFVQAIVAVDAVKAKDKTADLELVESHRALIGAERHNLRTVEDSDGEAQGSATATEAPSLD